MTKFTPILIPSLGFLVVACTANVREQPASSVAPTTPDTCDEQRFTGVFDFARVAHRGDTAYCETAAETWNQTERPRTIRFWRSIDGSWSSEYVDAPQAGTTTYTLDLAACELESSASSSYSERDFQGALSSVPLVTRRTVRLTDDGVSVELAHNHGASSNTVGLPCNVTSTTAGSRR